MMGAASATSGQNSPILVIGVGNEFRRDDAAGLLVARAISTHHLSEVVVKEASGDGADLMEQWENAETVLLIDAVQSGAMAGTVIRIDLNEQSLPPAYFPCSSHAFGVPQAVAMARILNQLPRRLVLFGIEGRDFHPGTEISREVQEAVSVVAIQLLEELQSMRSMRDDMKYSRV